MPVRTVIRNGTTISAKVKLDYADDARDREFALGPNETSEEIGGRPAIEVRTQRAPGEEGVQFSGRLVASTTNDTDRRLRVEGDFDNSGGRDYVEIGETGSFPSKVETNSAKLILKYTLE